MAQISIFVWALAGCPASTQTYSAALARTPVAFSTIQKGSYSGIQEPLQIVIQDQDEWVALWTRHSSVRSKPVPPPDVDFSSEMVAGVFLGEKTTGGHVVEISAIETEGSRLHLFYREKSPPTDAMVAQVLTQPFHLVKLRKYQATPVFMRKDP